MTKGLNTHAYTIVEVMIVLAVTGALLVMVMRTVSGQRERAEFTQSINDIQAQINDVINNVATGYYPNNGNLSCTATPLGPDLSTASQEQGTNEGCIFMGQAMQFAVGNDRNAYKIYDIVGLRRDSDGNVVQSIDDALPEAIANPPNGADTTQLKALQYGLGATTMYYTHAGANVPVSTVAFVSSLANYSGGELTSGSHRVELRPVQDGANISTTGGGLSGEAGATAINESNLDVIPDGGVVICFDSGGSRYGRITIGGNGRQLTTGLVIGQGVCT